MEHQLAEAEAQWAAEAAAAAAVGAPPPPVPTPATNQNATASLITLFNNRFDNMDSVLAKEHAEREKLEEEIRSSRRPRKRSASPGLRFTRRETHTRRESPCESNKRTNSSWNDVASKIPVFL